MQRVGALKLVEEGRPGYAVLAVELDAKVYWLIRRLVDKSPAVI